MLCLHCIHPSPSPSPSPSMSTKGSNQISQRAGVNKATISHKRSSINGATRNKGFTRNCGFRLPKKSELLPVRFVKHLGGKVAKGLCLVAMRKRPSPKVSSSGRSNPFVTPVDSHRAEAIEDCIEFINSSSSLPRSNSVSVNPC